MCASVRLCLYYLCACVGVYVCICVSTFVYVCGHMHVSVCLSPACMDRCVHLCVFVSPSTSVWSVYTCEGLYVIVSMRGHMYTSVCLTACTWVCLCVYVSPLYPVLWKPSFQVTHKPQAGFPLWSLITLRKATAVAA